MTGRVGKMASANDFESPKLFSQSSIANGRHWNMDDIPSDDINCSLGSRARCCVRTMCIEEIGKYAHRGSYCMFRLKFIAATDIVINASPNSKLHCSGNAALNCRHPFSFLPNPHLRFFSPNRSWIVTNAFSDSVMHLSKCFRWVLWQSRVLGVIIRVFGLSCLSDFVNSIKNLLNSSKIIGPC